MVLSGSGIASIFAKIAPSPSVSDGVFSSRWRSFIAIRSSALKLAFFLVAFATTSPAALGGQQPDRIFDVTLQRLHEARRVPAVDHPVVAAQRQVHALGDVDLAVNHDDLVLDLVDGDDRD